MEPIAHQPTATFVASSISAFWTTWCERSEPHRMEITWIIWPRDLPSAISLAKSLARGEYEFAKCRPGPFLCCFKAVRRHEYCAWVLLIHYNVWLQVHMKHCKRKITSLVVTTCGLLNYIPQLLLSRAHTPRVLCAWSCMHYSNHVHCCAL